MSNIYFLNKPQQQGIVLHSVSEMAKLEDCCFTCSFGGQMAVILCQVPSGWPSCTFEME